MTLAAKRRYIRRSGPAKITLAEIFCGVLIILQRVTAVTVITRKSAGKMNIVPDRACGIAHFPFQTTVAIDT
jgi:hypothetical protein